MAESADSYLTLTNDIVAFVPVPKDLSKVKTKVMFGLTSRQLIFFGLAGVIAIPTFILLNNHLGNELSMFIVFLIIAPLIFFAIFEKDGLTWEKYLKKMIEVKFKKPSQRVYRNDNQYEWLNDTTVQYMNYKAKKK